jgi:hypothetical protein
VWRAFRDGNLIAYGFTLMVFLERLEAQPELLGVAQDCGLHLLARNPLVLLPRVPKGRPQPAGHPVQAGDARGWDYPRAPHTGQAPMPWLARTFWATDICWAGVARFADEAYRPPPLASQVCSVNCSPP